MKNNFLYIIVLFSVIFSGYTYSSDAITLKIKNQRQAFYRNEEVNFACKVINETDSNLENVKITVAVHPVNPDIKKLADFTGYTYARDILNPLPDVVKTMTLKKGKSGSVDYKLNCSLLKEGEYYLEVIAENKNSTDKKRQSIYISQQPNPQRFPVYLWGNNAHLMDWAIAHGFNEMQIGDFMWPISRKDSTVAIFNRILDEAVKKKVDIGMYYYTFNPDYYKDHPEVNAVQKPFKAKGRIDGQYYEKICLREPYVTKFSKEIADSSMRLFSEYPSLNDVLINSEYIATPCYSENCITLFKNETGMDLYKYDIDLLKPPKTIEEIKKLKLPSKFENTVPKNGIIDDSNPFYKYYLWWWKKGLGDVPLNKKIADVIKSYRSDVMTWSDPFRLAPVYGRKSGLDCIGTWIYTHPDPKYMGYVDMMIAEAKPDKQKIMPSLTTWEYANWLAPEDSGTVMIPKDIFKENGWIALSRRPDYLCTYVSTPFLPTTEVDTWRRDPETFEAMSQLSENLYKPYGPFILQTERVPKKAALLISAASVLYSVADRGEWANKSIFPFYSLLMMAHIPTDIVFDETISKDGLDGYDILFLHKTETMPRSVYDKILAFKKRGGIVVADKYLRADISVDYKIKFNLDHRKLQFVDKVEKGEGVTADEDLKLMTKYSAEIKKALSGKVTRFVDSSSPEVVFNVLQQGPVKYVFMINDKRTYDDHFGKWKTMHTKGVDQTVEATINYKGKGTPTLYDLRTHKIIPVTVEKGTLKFSRYLKAADAAIVAVYPEPLNDIDIQVAKYVKRGEEVSINITVKDKKGESYGSQPLYVRITQVGDTDTNYSGYYATKDGKLNINIVPAVNDWPGTWRVEVRDLTSDIKSFTEFKVK